MKLSLYLSSVCTVSFLKRFFLFFVLGVSFLHGVKPLHAAADTDHLPALCTRGSLTAAPFARPTALVAAVPRVSTVVPPPALPSRRSAVVSSLPLLPEKHAPVPFSEPVSEAPEESLTASVRRTADDGRDEASSCTGFSTSSLSGAGSLMERSVGVLMKKLGVELLDPPVDGGDVAHQRATSVAYKAAIAACLGALDSMIDAVGIIDLQTELLIYCNTPMQSIFGHLRKDLMFRLICDFLDLKEEQKGPFLEGIRTVLHHGQSQQAGTGARGIFRHTSNVTGLLYDGLASHQIVWNIRFQCLN